MVRYDYLPRVNVDPPQPDVRIKASPRRLAAPSPRPPPPPTSPPAAAFHVSTPLPRVLLASVTLDHRTPYSPRPPGNRIHRLLPCLLGPLC
jgi:hypothetical protein